MRCVLFFASLLVLAGTPVSARVIIKDDFCQGGSFVAKNQAFGEGIAGPGAHVYYDREKRHLEGPRCKTAHVPPGAHTLLGFTATA